ncbi:MAG: hypothetical protein [Cryophage ML09]|nr:MAG: hypothetical protein [Cryophage ML09]
MLKIFTIFFCPSNQSTVHPSHITVLLPYTSSHTIVLLPYPSSQAYPDSKATVLLSYQGCIFQALPIYLTSKPSKY